MNFSMVFQECSKGVCLIIVSILPLLIYFLAQVVLFKSYECYLSIGLQIIFIVKDVKN